MIRLKLALAALSVVVVSGSLMAAENPNAAAIHNQIKGLKSEKEVTIKAVHATYDGWIKRDRFTEEVLITIRKAVKAEEEALLAVAPSQADKDAIHAHYDTLRGILKAETKLDVAVIHRLREMREMQLKVVRNVYDSKIKFLEAEAKQLSQIKPPPKPKK